MILMREYDQISRVYIGWSFSEIRELTHRERKFWLDASNFRISQVNQEVKKAIGGPQ